MESLVSDISPRVSLVDLSPLVLENYSLTIQKIVPLNGYDDKNYYIKVSPETRNPHITKVREDGYVLKIMNSLDSKYTDFIMAQHEMIRHLEERGIRVPTPVRNVNGDTYFMKTFSGDVGHVVRLMIYQPGAVLKSVPATPQLLRNVGKFVGRLSNTLEDFRHPAYDSRQSIWMLEKVLMIREILYVVPDPDKLKIVQDVLQQFEETVLANMHNLRRGTIHGDINEHNVIVRNEDVEALLDFGDSHNSAYMFELAICMCYMMMHSNGIDGSDILSGYLENRPLEPLEKEYLKLSICARLCQSLVIGLHSYQLQPNNEYLLSSQENGWTILKKLINLSREDVFRIWGLDE